MNPCTSLVLRGATPRELLQVCGGLLPPARRLSFAHPTPLPLPLPFPQLFGPEVSTRGLLQGPRRPEGSDVEACPVATHLHAAAHAGRCSALQHMVRTMQ